MVRPGAPAWISAVTGLGFAVLVTGLKLGQHFSLQTQSMDLGAFANVIWNTSHGRFFHNSLDGTFYLGSHFSPILILLAPLFWLWENAAVLLVFQSVILALSIPLVHALAVKITGKQWAGAAYSVLFALSSYVHRVSRDDFHEVALAIPLILALLLCIEKRRLIGGVLLAVMIVLIREDLSLVLMGVGLTLAIQKKESPESNSWLIPGLGMAIACFAIFFGEAAFLMPRLTKGDVPAYYEWYAQYGQTVPEMLRSVLQPEVLWTNSLGNPAKRFSLLLFLTMSGGLIVMAPRQLLLLVIPLAINTLSGHPFQYNLDGHYSATVVPFLFYAMIHGQANLSVRWPANRWVRPPVALGAVLGLSLVANLANLPRYFHPIGWERMRDARKVLRSIPKEDSVSTQNNLIPHLCLRERIQNVPTVDGAEWVLLDTESHGWNVPEEIKSWMVDFMVKNKPHAVGFYGGILVFRAPASSSEPRSPMGQAKRE